MHFVTQNYSIVFAPFRISHSVFLFLLLESWHHCSKEPFSPEKWTGQGRDGAFFPPRTNGPFSNENENSSIITIHSIVHKDSLVSPGEPWFVDHCLEVSASVTTQYNQTYCIKVSSCWVYALTGWLCQGVVEYSSLVSAFWSPLNI